MRSTHWPLFDLRVVTPRVELRPPSDDDLAELAALAAEGVHEPDYMPFSIPWTDGGPEAAARNTLQFNWRIRAEWKPDAWHLSFVTVVGGEIVGMQGIAAQQLRGHQDGRDRLVARAPPSGQGHRQGDARRGAALRVRRPRAPRSLRAARGRTTRHRSG